MKSELTEILKLRSSKWTRPLISSIMWAASVSSVSRFSMQSMRVRRLSSELAFAPPGYASRTSSRFSRQSVLATVRHMSNAPKPDDKAESHQPFAGWDAILEPSSPDDRAPVNSGPSKDSQADDEDPTRVSIMPVRNDALPPRARPMPPALESFESSHGYENGLGGVDDFGAYDYQPHLHDDGGSTALPTAPPTISVREYIPAQSAEWDDSGSTVMPSPPRPQFAPKLPMPPRSTFHGTASVSISDRQSVYDNAASGQAITSTTDMLKSKMKQLEQEIYAQNNGKEFNIKSPKQVSEILYGSAGQSTNKEALEAMGGAGNRMADLILQFRQCVRSIAREEKKEDDISKGRIVKSISPAPSPSRVNDKKAADSDLPYEDDPLLLVDASAYIFRAYYSMPPMHRADGTPIGAVLGFCNMLNRLVLNRLLQGERPRLVLVFDAKGRTFRHDMYDDYKANRPECPMDLIPQFDLIREVAVAYGIHQLEAPSFEADDVIATLATMALREGVNTDILSGDKDLMQLVTAEDATPAIHMIDPGSMSRVTHDVVVEKWGVEPKLVGDVLALAGDSSDNVPGVKGIGPKIAASLLDEFGTLDNLLESLDEVKQKGRREKLQASVDVAKLSRRLVELDRDIPIANMTFPEEVGSVADLQMEAIDGDRMLALYENMGFRDLKRRFGDRLKQRDQAQAKAPEAKKRPARRSNKRPKASIPQPEDYKDVPF